MTRAPARWPDHDYIASRLPVKGHTWVAKRLGLPPARVWKYADRHHIRFADIPGWTRTTTLAKAANQDAATVWNRARREGIMRRVGPPRAKGHARACLVPNKWADQYLAEIDAKRDGDDLQNHEGWLTVPAVMRMWRVGRGTILRGLNGEGVLAPLLADARTARGSSHSKRGKWLVHPADAERIAAHLDADRRKARTMIATKSIAVECRVSQSRAADIGKELGGELLFVHGRHMRHVTRATAQVMRARFARQPELKDAA